MQCSFHGSDMQTVSSFFVRAPLYPPISLQKPLFKGLALCELCCVYIQVKCLHLCCIYKIPFCTTAGLF